MTEWNFEWNGCYLGVFFSFSCVFDTWGVLFRGIWLGKVGRRREWRGRREEERWVCIDGLFLLLSLYFTFFCFPFSLAFCMEGRGERGRV